jgi:hypothetical protein
VGTRSGRVTRILDDRYCSGVKTSLWYYCDSSAGMVDQKFGAVRNVVRQIFVVFGETAIIFDFR